MEDLREVDQVVEEADKSRGELLDAAARYSEAMNGYQHMRAGELPESLEPVSANELYREAKLFVNRIEEHRERIKTLREAKRGLETISDHLTIPGEDINAERLEKHVSELYETYMEDLEKANRVANRGEKMPGTPNPVYMKSDLVRDFDPFEENMSMIQLLEQGY